MSLEEKAKEYALKALESEIEKVQKAYIDGYNAAKAEYNHEPIIDENGIKWYDMDLPSGNLWSEPLKDEEENWLELTFNEAAKYDLPTEEDRTEFYKMTKSTNCNGGYQYKSINAKTYQLPNDGNKHRYFWLKSDPSYNEIKALAFSSDMTTVMKLFKGDRHCVVLIKRKK